MHKIEFLTNGRMPKCAPNPDYPNGKEVNIADKAEPFCEVDIPYPAECCGIWRIECTKCGISIGVTAAGRPDDPTKATFNCKQTRH